MAMDSNKQKILLGVLVVLLVGMGGGTYWFVFRDTAPKYEVTTDQSKVQRRERRTSGATKEKRTRRSRRTAREDEEERVERRERKVGERKKSHRRRRTKGRKTIKKKKKELPPVACLPPYLDRFEEFDPNDFRPPVFA